MARALDLQGLAELAGLPFDLGGAAELALLFSENAGLQVDHLLFTVTLGLSSFGAALLSFAILCQVIHAPKHQRGYQGDHQPWPPGH
ncbi:hypothetical protein [Pseudomonas aeruginosa]|uniref:hypothetical protein n=1 Tax=Pseudomonas aeruginosa TaxID=287 RepID=UPI000A49CFC0|nr:hypothetical protein [Pseudomonas aeruginosa]MBH9359329.1 hypothetical protein [Pseudomonas aeruginosa]MEE3598235.1 hypothetical protein [Pseudomonas aeruginosa]